MLPSGLGAASRDVEQPLVPTHELAWVQPIPSAMLDTDADDPAAALVRSGQVRLAFIVALQTLPAQQRSVLILCEVLRFSAAEVAEMLGLTSVAVNSSLQRARVALSRREPNEDSVTAGEPNDSDLLLRYTDAPARADIDGLSALLVDDAVMEMPPVPLWYQGRDDFLGFMSRAYRLRGTDWRVLHVSANGQPAFGAYSPGDGGYRPHSIQVLSTNAGSVTHNVVFFEPTLFEMFGLPSVLEGSEGPGR